MPKSVCTYLLFDTREIVEMSAPTSCAIVLRIIGLRSLLSPVMKYSRWCCIIAYIVLYSNISRNDRVLMNCMPSSTYFFMKRSASARRRSDSSFDKNRYSLLNSLLIRTFGTYWLLRVRISFPSRLVMVKSGIITSAFFCIGLPNAAGRGSSF